MRELRDRPQLAQFGREVGVVAGRGVDVGSAAGPRIGREAVDQRGQSLVAIGGHEA